jgi:hypothetical protein
MVSFRNLIGGINGRSGRDTNGDLRERLLPIHRGDHQIRSSIPAKRLVEASPRAESRTDFFHRVTKIALRLKFL